MRFIPFGFMKKKKIDTVNYQFRYTMDLPSYTANATISDFKIELYPYFIVCPNAISGTDPFTFTSSIISTGITFNDFIYVYRSICKTSGSNFSIQAQTVNLYVNGILRSTNGGGGDGTPYPCPTVTTKYFNLAPYPIVLGDNVLIEWIDN
jgi:hypothetical protein